ncbi:hypothetical protein SAMN05421812_104101 [Asanoa hainanensis]|uniref:WD40-like Beta Propeller Repeat n=1 Tax=Asanoa hainanensis TaxID=560556 RepID=A0A239L863_9ACTN|nr:hypothetical protein [Asanoa hainanensis]SNT26470.1 hypothetical protein SAMN05421812_104101 [Asanoa hainanensis]
MKRGKPAARLLAACLLLTLGGCATTRAEVVSRSPVWLSADAIYFLRAAGPAPAELWTRDPESGEQRAVGAAVPDPCGPLDYLFRVPDGRLGLALRCGQTGRLVAFDPASASFERLADLASWAPQVTLSTDLRGGYGAGVNDGCWSLSTIALPRGDLSPTLPELTCAAGASARSPALTRWGGLVFAATRDAPPAGDKRRWSVHLAGFQGVPYKGIGPTFEGLPDVDLSPDESTAAVTATKFGRSRLILVSLKNGESHELLSSTASFSDPSFAPDGTRVAYSDLRAIRVVSLPGPSRG